MRLLQIGNGAGERRLGQIEGQELVFIEPYRSVYELAQAALAAGRSLDETASRHLSNVRLDYDEIYEGRSEWRVLPSADHPEEPARCLVSGTGLTHKRSAANRQAMHAEGTAPTDSMLMYEWGVDGGRPPEGRVGVAPEWFYKGSGGILRGHLQPLVVPAYAEDGGEEPEVACVYLIDSAGVPRRLGMTPGNEFSDHRFEKRNYLYLAASKLRNCAIGPELITDAEFNSLAGQVSIERAGETWWASPILSGDEAMSHSLANLEHHHFKYEAHRRPGDVHVHFLGADAFSFGQGVTLEEGDIMQVQFKALGRALRNPVRFDRTEESLVRVMTL